MEKITELARWMRAERDRLGWSTADVARHAREVAELMGDPLKLSQQSVSAFENEHPKSVPRWLRYVNEAIALEALGADERRARVAELAHGPGLASEAPPSPIEEEEWVACFRSLGPADRHAALQLIRSMAEKERALRGSPGA